MIYRGGSISTIIAIPSKIVDYKLKASTIGLKGSEIRELSMDWRVACFSLFNPYKSLRLGTYFSKYV